MLKKILFVATYDDMLDIAGQTAAERGGNMDIVTGELFDAVENVSKCDISEKEVIVSRGGTARLLRKSFNLPVVEVEVCAYDILRAVYKYKDQRIAVVGADNVISGVKVIEEIMGLDICYFPFTFENEIEEKINMVCAMNIRVVVGDTVAVRIAKRRGLKCELVRSGKESVSDAIDRAEKICAAILQEREKSSRINAIIEHMHEGIVVIDEQYRIVLLNHVSENMFEITRHEVLGKNVDLILPEIEVASVLESGRCITRQILPAKSGFVAINKIPIMVEDNCKGVVITCEDVTQIQELEQKIRQTLSKRGLIAKRRFEDIIGESAEIKNTINLAKKYAGVDSTVLIYGESGTGKELFAQSIHNCSLRKSGPFIAINCATLPSNLLESTLFGYDEGAFTGAKKGGKKGVFELAHNGTLFLDEITEMDLSIQSKILRVLQEHEVMRLGGDSMIPVNVRIIAASNKRLKTAVDANLFREDLFYRVSVLNIDIPPLRERKDDIILLTNFFINIYCQKNSKPLTQLTDKVLHRFRTYSWPGNIRQLENVVQKITLICEDGNFKDEDMDHFLVELKNDAIQTEEMSYTGTLDDITRSIIISVLKEEQYNKTKTAQRLGVTRATLNSRLKTV